MTCVLLIDDDDIQARLLRAFLEMRYGARHRLRHARGVRDARAALREERFDAVLLDNRLGFEGDIRRTLPRLRDALAGTRVLVISASADDPHLRSAHEHGVERVIDKYDLRDEIDAGLVDAVAEQAVGAAVRLEPAVA